MLQESFLDVRLQQARNHGHDPSGWHRIGDIRDLSCRACKDKVTVRDTSEGLVIVLDTLDSSCRGAPRKG